MKSNDDSVKDSLEAGRRNALFDDELPGRGLGGEYCPTLGGVISWRRGEELLVGGVLGFRRVGGPEALAFDAVLGRVPLWPPRITGLGLRAGLAERRMFSGIGDSERKAGELRPQAPEVVLSAGEPGRLTIGLGER